MMHSEKENTPDGQGREQEKKKLIVSGGCVCARACNSARVIRVIETKATRGSGNPEDPFREVTEFWSLDGKKLAESDPYWRSMSRASSNASSDST